MPPASLCKGGSECSRALRLGSDPAGPLQQADGGCKHWEARPYQE
jgi:hypothetical protein